MCVNVFLTVGRCGEHCLKPQTTIWKLFGWFLPTNMFCLAYTKYFFWRESWTICQHLNIWRFYAKNFISSLSWELGVLASWPMALHGNWHGTRVSSLFRERHVVCLAPVSTHLGHLPGSRRHCMYNLRLYSYSPHLDLQNPLFTLMSTAVLSDQ